MGVRVSARKPVQSYAVDTTQLDVMETALKCLGGRAIVNSINFEDGEEKCDAVCRLAKRYGAALVERVDGSPTNVIGLPLAETVTLLRRSGVPVG